MDNDRKFADTFLMVLACVFGMLLIVIVGLNMSIERTKEQMDNMFKNDCSKACHPNRVYSAENKVCMCDVSVVYKPVN